MAIPCEIFATLVAGPAPRVGQSLLYNFAFGVFSVAAAAAASSCPHAIKKQLATASTNATLLGIFFFKGERFYMVRLLSLDDIMAQFFMNKY